MPLELPPRQGLWARIVKELDKNGPEYIANTIAVIIAVVLLAGVYASKGHLP